MDLPSNRMNQPQWMRGRKHRRECVTVDGDDAWALFCAAADGDLARARELVEKDPALIHAQLTYTWPIDLALREGHLDIAKLFHAADRVRLKPFAVGRHDARISEDELARSKSSNTFSTAGPTGGPWKIGHGPGPGCWQKISSQNSTSGAARRPDIGSFTDSRRTELARNLKQ